MAAGTVAALVPVTFRNILCCAATGIAEFFWGCAFVPVARAARLVRVLFPTGTGVHLYSVIVGLVFIFGHLLTVFLH